MPPTPHIPPNQRLLLNSPEATRACAEMRAGHHPEAIAIAQAALRKTPKDHELRYILAQSLLRTNATAKALPHLQALTNEHPENHGFRIEFAHALERSGQTEEALEQLDRVLRDHPEHDHAIRIRVNTLRGMGRGAQAWDELFADIDKLPRTANIALSLSSVIPKDADPAVVIQWLTESAKDESTSIPNRQAAWCSASRLHEREGDFSLAFDAATHANDLVPPNQPDHNHAAMVSQLNEDLHSRIEPAAPSKPTVVLICGMPRSGSTVTEQLIAAHPKATSAGEFPGLPKSVSAVVQHAVNHGIVPREVTTKAAKNYIKSLRAATGDPTATVLIDKLPTNHLLLGVAAKLLPGLRVIHTLRDPRDIAISCYTTDFGNRHAYRSRLSTLADELLLHARAAERWRAQLGEAYLESSLEELIADPKTNAKRLIAHVGLGWDDACLRFHEKQAHVRTASAVQVQSGLNASGVGRWKNYQSQLAPLIEKLTASGILE